MVSLLSLPDRLAAVARMVAYFELLSMRPVYTENNSDIMTIIPGIYIGNENDRTRAREVSGIGKSVFESASDLCRIINQKHIYYVRDEEEIAFQLPDFTTAFVINDYCKTLGS